MFAVLWAQMADKENVPWFVLCFLNRLNWDVRPLCSACVMKASIWTSILSSMCCMHSSDSSLALLCTPASLPSRPFHTTEVRDSACMCVFVCVWVVCKEESWSVYGEKLSTFWASGVVRFVVLKNSDSMSPTSPCCKRGLISAFMHGTSVWGCVCVFVCNVRMCVCLLKCNKFIPLSVCFCVRGLQYMCVCGALSTAQLFNIYLLYVENTDLEDDLRINAILKQNTTCQIFLTIFSPSWPDGMVFMKRSECIDPEPKGASVYLYSTHGKFSEPKCVSFSVLKLHNVCEKVAKTK